MSLALKIKPGKPTSLASRLNTTRKTPNHSYLNWFTNSQTIKKILPRLLRLLLTIGLLPCTILGQRLDLTKPLAIKWFNKLSDESRFAPVYGSDTVNLALNSGKLIAVQASNGQLIWKADLGGQINHLVADGQAVFVLTETILTPSVGLSTSSQVSLLAVSQKSGLTLWRRHLPEIIKGGMHSDTSLLFFGTSDGFVKAISKTTGETVWSKRVSSEAFLSILGGDGDIFLCGEDGSIISLKTQDGSLNWRYQTPKALRSSIALVGDCLTIGTISGQILCFNKNTGQLRWRSHINSELQTLTGVGQGFIASASDNYVYFFSISLGKRVWKRRFAGRIVIAPLIEGGNALFVYPGSSEGVVLSWKDGKYLNTIQVDESNAITAAPVIVKDFLLVPTRAGLVGFASRS